ncbi:tRNA-i(6)A37 thiotransferase enzyme MiaB, partial [Vibrio parahaemolyticus VPTS-2010]
TSQSSVNYVKRVLISKSVLTLLLVSLVKQTKISKTQ